MSRIGGRGRAVRSRPGPLRCTATGSRCLRGAFRSSGRCSHRACHACTLSTPRSTPRASTISRGARRPCHADRAGGRSRGRCPCRDERPWRVNRTLRQVHGAIGVRKRPGLLTPERRRKNNVREPRRLGEERVGDHDEEPVAARGSTGFGEDPAARPRGWCPRSTETGSSPAPRTGRSPSHAWAGPSAGSATARRSRALRAPRHAPRSASCESPEGRRCSPSRACSAPSAGRSSGGSPHPACRSSRAAG